MGLPFYGDTATLHGRLDTRHAEEKMSKIGSVVEKARRHGNRNVHLVVIH